MCSMPASRNTAAHAGAPTQAWRARLSVSKRQSPTRTWQPGCPMLDIANPGVPNPGIPTLISQICRVQNPDIQRAVRGGAAHGGAAGGAGQAGSGRRRVGLPRRHPSRLPPRALKQTVLDVSSEGRTNKYPCKAIAEQSERLIRGTAAALRSWLLTSGPTPFCSCEPFSRKACPGTRMLQTWAPHARTSQTRVPNLDVPQNRP